MGDDYETYAVVLDITGKSNSEGGNGSFNFWHSNYMGKKKYFFRNVIKLNDKSFTW